MKLLAFEKSVGAVVFRIENGKVLFLLLYNNYWGFPKGHPEAGENEEETLRRETLEETGIRDLAVIPGFKKSNYYFYVAKGAERERRMKAGRGIWIFKRAVFYVASAKNGKVVISDEHDDYKWVGFEDAIRMMRHENAKELFRKAHDFILKAGLQNPGKRVE